MRYYLSLILNTVPRLSLDLSQNARGMVKNYFRILKFLFLKKMRKDVKSVVFELHYQHKNFLIRLFEGSTDIAALKEIFLDKEYEWDELKNPKIILDLGAHTGNTAIYFHLRYPNAVIYAVEASPATFRYLKENVAHIPQIRPFFGAVSGETGTISFYESESSLGSSLRQRNVDQKRVVVPSFTLPDLHHTLGIEKADLIKVDIEGSEESVFRSLDPARYSSAYMIEVHADLMDISQQEFLNKFAHYSQALQHTNNPNRCILRAKLLP